MSHAKNIELWLEYAERKGIQRPLFPLDRALKILGCKCRPIVFWNVAISGIFMGVCFSIWMGLVLYLPCWIWGNLSFHTFLLFMGATGVLASLIAAWQMKTLKAKLSLPRWNELIKGH